ncbi:hypothetical protein VNO78_31006 [Psophocarpus tetragonolobus]|uniref:Uncharacterized protein n=1 Tax=Psophocarpus tetragonolobus TaxID=3891 RepID=A0AAN9X7R9_PSOTE
MARQPSSSELYLSYVWTMCRSRVTRQSPRLCRWSRPCRTAPSALFHRDEGQTAEVVLQPQRSDLKHIAAEIASRVPRSRRRSRLARPDCGGDCASHAQIAAEIASRPPRSRRRSRLARPDRGGDRVSRAQIAAEIAFRSTAQIPADLGAFGSFSATCSSGSPSPSSGSTAALRIVPDPVGSWRFGASRAACSAAVPRASPALQKRRRENRFRSALVLGRNRVHKPEETK